MVIFQGARLFSLQSEGNRPGGQRGNPPSLRKVFFSCSVFIGSGMATAGWDPAPVFVVAASPSSRPTGTTGEHRCRAAAPQRLPRPFSIITTFFLSFPLPPTPSPHYLHPTPPHPTPNFFPFFFPLFFPRCKLKILHEITVGGA